MDIGGRVKTVNKSVCNHNSVNQHCLICTKYLTVLNNDQGDGNFNSVDNQSNNLDKNIHGNVFHVLQIVITQVRVTSILVILKIILCFSQYRLLSHGKS